LRPAAEHSAAGNGQQNLSIALFVRPDHLYAADLLTGKQILVDQPLVEYQLPFNNQVIAFPFAVM